jgi:hypothetical protein
MPSSASTGVSDMPFSGLNKEMTAPLTFCVNSSSNSTSMSSNEVICYSSDNEKGGRMKPKYSCRNTQCKREMKEDGIYSGKRNSCQRQRFRCVHCLQAWAKLFNNSKDKTEPVWIPVNFNKRKRPNPYHCTKCGEALGDDHTVSCKGKKYEEVGENYDKKLIIPSLMNRMW